VKLIKLDYNDIDIERVDEVAIILKEGGLVVFPTETVYGLGVNVDNEEAVGKVYRIKNRPRHKPLSLHIADPNIMFSSIDEVSKDLEDIVDRFWPGPLTIIVNTVSGKRGFRMPDDKIALELIKRSKVNVVAPSANLSSHPPPKDASQISEDIRKHVDIIIDAGRTKLGVESTVLDASTFPYKVLREGAISSKSII